MIDLRFTFGNVDPPLEPLEGIELDLADDDNRVAFGDFVFGVSELLGQFAVVGQEDQSGARCIESSDWKQALLVGYKVDHARSSLGIAIGAQDSFGFVQCVIDRTVLFEQLDSPIGAAQSSSCSTQLCAIRELIRTARSLSEQDGDFAQYLAAAVNTSLITAVNLQVGNALASLTAAQSTLGSTNAILAVRLEFSQSYVATLQNGAAQLTTADLNEESANLTSLQTAQSLGVVSLSITNQAQQSLLRLF